MVDGLGQPSAKDIVYRLGKGLDGNEGFGRLAATPDFELSDKLFELTSVSRGDLGIASKSFSVAATPKRSIYLAQNNVQNNVPGQFWGCVSRYFFAAGRNTVFGRPIIGCER